MAAEPQRPECTRLPTRWRHGTLAEETQHYSEQLALANQVVVDVLDLDARLAAEQARDAELRRR